MRLPGRAAGTASAEFAGILDGRALWLAVPLADLGGTSASTWGYALRDEAGTLTPLGGEVDGAHLAVVADLPTRPGTYDVLVTDGADARPVVAEQPPPGPTRTPDQGPVRYELAHGDDGLRVTVSPLAGTAGVVEVGLDGSALTLTVTGEASDDAALLFIEDKVDLGTVPLARGPRGLTASLTVDNVPGSHMRLMVVDGDERRQVRRMRNGLTAPGRSVLLPLVEDDRGEPVLVLKWHPDAGNLRLHRTVAKPEAR